METESILSGHSEYGNRMQNGHRTTPRPLPPLKGNIMYTILLLLLKCLLCAMEHKEIWCITKQFAPFHSFCTLVFKCHCRLLLKCEIPQCPKNMIIHHSCHLGSNKVTQCKMVCKKGVKLWCYRPCSTGYQSGTEAMNWSCFWPRAN